MQLNLWNNSNYLLFYLIKEFASQILLKAFSRKFLVGSNGIEPSTSRLSGVRSNHLSYEPINVKLFEAIYKHPLECTKKHTQN